MLGFYQYSQSGTLVDAVVVENVDATDRFARGIEVNHQTELFHAEQVVVTQ